MKSVAGIFSSRDAAERAIRRLAASGIPREHLTLLTPGTDVRRLSSVPVDEGEPPGTGAARGKSPCAADTAAVSARPAAISPRKRGVRILLLRLTTSYFPLISDFANRRYHSLGAGDLGGVVAEIANFRPCEK